MIYVVVNNKQMNYPSLILFTGEFVFYSFIKTLWAILSRKIMNWMWVRFSQGSQCFQLCATSKQRLESHHILNWKNIFQEWISLLTDFFYFRVIMGFPDSWPFNKYQRKRYGFCECSSNSALQFLIKDCYALHHTHTHPRFRAYQNGFIA